MIEVTGQPIRVLGPLRKRQLQRRIRWVVIEAWRGDACTVAVAALTGERNVEHDHHEERHG